jgi:FtsH-binding integral membrane protein
MRISNLAKITLTTGIIGLIFLGLASFAGKLPHNYGLTAWLVSALFLIAFIFLIAYGEEQKGKDANQERAQLQKRGCFISLFL